MNMNRGHMAYFEKDDVLHLAISDETETGSVEVSPWAIRVAPRK